MNDIKLPSNSLSLHGVHYVRRSMALRMTSYFSEMPAEIRKHLGYDVAKKGMETYTYARVSKEQIEAALATVLDSEVPSK